MRAWRDSFTELLGAHLARLRQSCLPAKSDGSRSCASHGDQAHIIEGAPTTRGSPRASWSVAIDISIICKTKKARSYFLTTVCCVRQFRSCYTLAPAPAGLRPIKTLS